MKIKGRYLVSAERDQVWAALNDEGVLSRCIPGVDRLEKVSNTEFAATVTTKVGPVKATFSGGVTLSDLDPPNGYRITGEGQGGVAGFAKGTCVVSLAEAQDETELSYEAEAQVGGKDSTRLNSLAIDMHNTCATLAGVTTNVCAGQTNVVPNKLHEQRSGLNFRRDRFPVYRHINC